MRTNHALALVGLSGLLICLPDLSAQTRPYTGFVYPAGGRQGTTFAVKAGGQGLGPVTGIEVTGGGVTARVVECYKRIGPQEITLLRDQLKILKDQSKPKAEPAALKQPAPGAAKQAPKANKANEEMIRRIEKRIEEYCNRPASNALADLVFLEVTIAADAAPGRRELRLVTPSGISNPLAFQVGQFPETTRKPMLTAPFQVLGKEELSLRKRPEEEVVVKVAPPCTMNGQIASGEVNRYRFAARKGQRLVVSALARELIPFLADAVPGWFQPVLALYDASGREIAYQDDFRFKPDPVILFEVPADGEYVVAISDAIHRGREDFIYRITLGEIPYLTGIFPLGGKAGAPAAVATKGWNLQGAEVLAPLPASGPGLFTVRAKAGGRLSNPLPFELDTLPEITESESADPDKPAQAVTLPVIVNGRIGTPGDFDVFEFSGKKDQAVAVQVSARRLDSPLDSVIRVTGPDGSVIALNDDYEDLAGGANTHHADSYALLTLPKDGAYRVHLGDTVRAGGDEYAYRLRISPARPDFELRVVPSSLTIRAKSSASLAVHVARRDGYRGPVKLELTGLPPGLTAAASTIPPDKTTTKISVKAAPEAAGRSFDLRIEGSAEIGGQTVRHAAVPTEDRMQAFLWRHLVPAANLRALVVDPDTKPDAGRPLPPPDPGTLAALAGKPDAPKFTESQIASRTRQVDQLFQEGLLTEKFVAQRLAECQVGK